MYSSTFILLFGTIFVVLYYIDIVYYECPCFSQLTVILRITSLL